ncbi:EndoU domain-containing protein [Flavobacterium aurantiibacter]|uniref:Bacterial EndoU nuclease domain-containing protein n=1 Tax=Flavobacterium aurantiibacter TaxID=2023067 RepID=A0A255ZQ09_9FLAO|nr:EndoU domain-containing protein [Flavobacterium aurantiibacter]OYQ43583.1 hypothetical protein CHX27_09545 [Flavobacterium aurantiibacter]
MDYCYIIIPNACNTAKAGLTIGERIFGLPTTWPLSLIPLAAEGPFPSINSLKECSNIYRLLKSKNPRRAHQITQNQYIAYLKGGLVVPENTILEKQIFDSWEHIVNGDFKSDGVIGMHFFNPDRIRILEKISENDQGVVSALIEVKAKNSDCWKSPKKAKTLFPFHWTASRLLAELHVAFDSKVAVTDSKNKFHSVTDSGIKVIFVIVNGKMKTVYPIL